jgi:hemoglobin
MKTISIIAATLLACASPALAAEPTNPAGAEPIAGDATYKAFHEKAGIQRIMDDFIVRITADTRIGRHFTTSDLPHLKAALVDQVCYLVGGPCTYGGKDMKSTHATMGLSDADFNALAEELQISMDKEGVAFAAQNKLLAKLAPMERVIVTD